MTKQKEFWGLETLTCFPQFQSQSSNQKKHKPLITAAAFLKRNAYVAGYPGSLGMGQQSMLCKTAECLVSRFPDLHGYKHWCSCSLADVKRESRQYNMEPAGLGRPGGSSKSLERIFCPSTRPPRLWSRCHRGIESKGSLTREYQRLKPTTNVAHALTIP